MIWANQVAKIAFVSGHLIVPGVILFVFMGAWLGGDVSIGSWITLLIFGILGYLMKVSGWARPPLVLGLILGTIVENRFLLSVTAHDGFSWLAKPLVLFLLGLVFVTLYFAIKGIRNKKNETKDKEEQGEGRASNPVISSIVSIALIFIFSIAFWIALDWPQRLDYSH